MEQCCTLNGVQFFITCKFSNQIFHLFRNKEWIRRYMIGSHDSNRNTAIYTTIIGPVHEYQRMDLLDNAFRKRNVIFYYILYIEKSISMTNYLQVVFQRLLINGDTFQNQSGFLKSQCIAFDGIGVVGIFNEEFLTETL